MVVSFDDMLGRTLYVQWYSSPDSTDTNITAQKQIQYNALGEPTSVTMTDLVPQAGQTITSVTATATYDDLGRMTSSNDPDKGHHSYTYDADGRTLTLRRSTTGSGTPITVYAFGLEEHVYSSSGTPQSSTYYYPLGGRLIGELQGSTTQFFLTDALGSIITTFNATAGSAAVQGNQLYGPLWQQPLQSGVNGH